MFGGVWRCAPLEDAPSREHTLPPPVLDHRWLLHAREVRDSHVARGLMADHVQSNG